MSRPGITRLKRTFDELEDYDYPRAKRPYGMSYHRANRPRRGFGSSALTRSEKKFKDTVFEDTAFTVGWAGAELVFLSMPTQGTTESSRLGRWISITDVSVNFTIGNVLGQGQASPTADIPWKLALVKDKQTNGTTLNAEDVYDTTTNTVEVDSFRNMKFSKRFDVIKTWKGVIGRGKNTFGEGGADFFAVGAQNMGPYTYTKVFKKPIRCELDGDAGTIADVQDVSFHLIGTSNTPACTMTGVCRIKYTST